MPWTSDTHPHPHAHTSTRTCPLATRHMHTHTHTNTNTNTNTNTHVHTYTHRHPLRTHTHRATIQRHTRCTILFFAGKEVKHHLAAHFQAIGSSHPAVKQGFYLGVAVSTEQALAVLQRAVAAIARKVSVDARQVLADRSPVVKKGSGHLRCHRWILLFGWRRAWRLSISLSHQRKVDGQRVPYLLIPGSPADAWAVCADFNP